jgi:hypothetical protein
MREPITLILRIEIGNVVANPLPTCQLAGMRHQPDAQGTPPQRRGTIHS